MWENTNPSTELPRDFCAGIGPLQFGVVLLFLISIFYGFYGLKKKKELVSGGGGVLKKFEVGANGPDRSG